MKTIRFNPLSAASIERAIAEVNAYQVELHGKLNDLVNTLADRGVEIAKINLAQLGKVYTGELSESITAYYSAENHVALVRADCWYAAYVEYGTGIVGAKSPHPSPPCGWKYDKYDHGEAGWFYHNDRDDKVHWTQGQPSAPFMYDTARELERICRDVAREVFGR